MDNGHTKYLAAGGRLDFMKDVDHFNNKISAATAVPKELLTGVGGSHAAASSSMGLFASYIKKVQDRLLNPPPKPRSKKDRRFRKELRQILDRHNALQNPELVKAAREMLTLLRYRQAGLKEVGGWYIRRKMCEESFSRRIFKVTRLTRECDET